MKTCTAWFVAILSVLLLVGCAERKPAAEPEKVVVPVPEAEAILSCHADQPKMTRKQFGAAYRAAEKQFAANATAENSRNMICLSLHPYANTGQISEGVEQVSLYIKEHPDNSAGMRGLRKLMQRVQKERSARLALSTRTAGKKDDADDDGGGLQEQNTQLRQAAEQDQEKIIELQRQIEQLKNIENIIKSREH